MTYDTDQALKATYLLTSPSSCNPSSDEYRRRTNQDPFCCKPKGFPLPGIGQNALLHAPPTARISVFLISTLLVHSTSFCVLNLTKRTGVSGIVNQAVIYVLIQRRYKYNISLLPIFFSEKKKELHFLVQNTYIHSRVI